MKIQAASSFCRMVARFLIDCMCKSKAIDNDPNKGGDYGKLDL